jgi:polysaccharide biosynthesis protein PslH
MTKNGKLQTVASHRMQNNPARSNHGMKKRILFVMLLPPFRPNNGHTMRNYVMLRALLEEGHQVSLISFADREERDRPATELEQLCASVDLIDIPGVGKQGDSAYWSRLQALGSPYPYGAWRFKSAEVQRAVTTRLASDDYDAVFCDGIYQMQNLPDSGMPPVVLNEHTVTHEALGRFLKHEMNPLKVLYGWMEYAKVRRWELRACSRVASIIACSERDRQILLHGSPGTDVSVVPNCIDTDAYSPVLDDDGKTLVFVGAMDWAPNQDAASYFVSDIFPQVRQAIPDARFLIAGRTPPAAFRERFAGIENVEFTGSVDDLRPILANAAVSVVPLRSGSGTRIKILEAAAMGKAIVSTSLGAEGLDYENGRELVIADDARTFASATIGLLRDSERRKSLAAAARGWVEQNHGFSALKSSIAAALGCVEAPHADNLQGRASA